MTNKVSGEPEQRIVVTRHAGLLEAAIRDKLVPEGTVALAAATAEDVAERVVIGNLPIDLATKASRIVTPLWGPGVVVRGREHRPANEIVGWAVCTVNSQSLFTVCHGCCCGKEATSDHMCDDCDRTNWP